MLGDLKSHSQHSRIPILIGMRGSGKSTIAPRLAKELGVNWVDADLELEHRTSKSIPELFAQGEPLFRNLEEELLVELCSMENMIVATGGGAVLSPIIRTILKERLTIFLDTPVDILSQRIQGSDRPSLTGKPIEDEIESTLQERRPFYESCAAVVIHVHQSTSPEDIVKSILGRIPAE